MHYDRTTLSGAHLTPEWWLCAAHGNFLYTCQWDLCNSGHSTQFRKSRHMQQHTHQIHQSIMTTITVQGRPTRHALSLWGVSANLVPTVGGLLSSALQTTWLSFLSFCTGFQDKDHKSWVCSWQICVFLKEQLIQILIIHKTVGRSFFFYIVRKQYLATSKLPRLYSSVKSDLVFVLPTPP